MASQDDVNVLELTVEMSYDQAQAMKVPYLMALQSSVRKFSADIRTVECFIQRMDQVLSVMDSAKLEWNRTEEFERFHDVDDRDMVVTRSWAYFRFNVGGGKSPVERVVQKRDLTYIFIWYEYNNSIGEEVKQEI